MNTNSSELHRRLQKAVKSADVPPELEASIRQRIAAAADRPAWLGWVRPAFGAVALVLVAGVAMWRGALDDQADFIATISARVPAIMRVGLGDHLHCAFFRKFPAKAPAAEEMRQAMGDAYKDLIAVVRKQVPEQYRLVLGHRCRHNGRQFIHLALKDGDQLLSLIVTRKSDGETFDVAGAIPAAIHARTPLHTGDAGEFQIAGFETANHLVYFVSNLQGARNREMLTAMVPSIKAILDKA